MTVCSMDNLKNVVLAYCLRYKAIENKQVYLCENIQQKYFK